MLMLFLRKATVWLAVLVLPLLLFALATNLALLRSAGSPDPIKDILRDSGIYDSAIDAVLEATDNPNDNGQPGGIRADNPVVREAAKKAFTPQLVQSSTENFIDGYYKWLEGKTSTPQFRIDLTSAKTTFVNEIAVGAQAKAASLPACPKGLTSFEDPFAATCLPRGVSPTVAGDKIRQELADGEEKFLKNPVITADTLKSKDNKPAFSDSSPLPENYQRLKKIPALLSVLALVAISTVIFLSESRQKGLMKVGVTLLVVGTTLLFFAWLASRVVNEVAIPKIKFDNATVQGKVRTLVSDVSETVGRNFMIAGGTYAALGAAATSGAIYLGRKSHPGKPKEAAVPVKKDGGSEQPTKSKGKV